MAGPIAGAVVAAAAPAVVESATDGLINRAFKIVMIGALLGVALLVIYIVSLVGGQLNLAEKSLFDLAAGFLGLSPAGGIFTLIGAGLAGFGSLAYRR